MRIVLDTNVLVAGLLSPHGPPAAILNLLMTGAVTLCFDGRILDEYRSVLQRPKFGFEIQRAEEILSYFEATGEMIVPTPLDLALPDPADAMFVEVGAAAAVDRIVTGNLKHFPAKVRRRISIISPREFVDLMSH